MVPVGLVNPYCSNDESVGVAKVDGEVEEAKGRARCQGGLVTGLGTFINIEVVISDLKIFLTE